MTGVQTCALPISLTNYITALGYGKDDKELFEKLWPANLQIVGKDIARFHLIYWPIFLMSLELTLPETILVHNWITMKDGKMSKSKGNVIYPEQLIEKYGLDATKYYLIRAVPTNSDGMFTPEEFVERYNSDLCNDLGNLLNRTIAMTNKYFNGNVPEYVGLVNDTDVDLENKVKETIEKFEQEFNNYEFANSLQIIWNLISRTNKYIDETSPWALAKEVENETEEAKKIREKKLKSVIYHLIANLKQIAILIRFLMQDTSDNILNQLGIKSEKVSLEDLQNYTELTNIKVIEKGEPLFMRLDSEAEVEYIKSLMKK